MGREPNFLKFLWNTYCVPHLDFASQLWMPLGTTIMKNIEHLQVSFMKTVNMDGHNISSDNYWKMLKFLRLYSIERRCECFKIIYTWKVLELLAPNYGISVTSSDTAGRLCSITPLITGISEVVKNLRLRSLQHMGPSLWNSLPAELRAVKGVSTLTFKAKLDAYLQCLPDEPWTKDQTPSQCHPRTGLPSNSVIHLARTHFGPTRRL